MSTTTTHPDPAVLQHAQQQPLHAAFDHALAYLAQPDTSVAATTSLSALRTRIDIPLNDEGHDPTYVVDHLVSAVEGGLVRSSGSRFFGWVVGGSLPSALATDWLVSTWDQNAALYAHSPAAAVVEETAGRWLKELLNIPETASFAFVTGCQQAHVTCLGAARHAVLERTGWNVEEQGLYGAPPIQILSSTELHGTTTRALRLLGFGQQNLHTLPIDEQGRLLPSALEEALKDSPNRPTIVVLQAGDLNIGAYDDFATLIPIAHQYNAWVHIDGAFGLWAAASPTHRHRMAGADQADSWATDGHKWLNVPYDSGYAFVAHPQAHLAAISLRAAYINMHEDARDQIDWNPEMSRRARGFATYAALRELGRNGVADLIDRCCTAAQALATGIGALPGAELLWTPTINQGLVRFPAPDPAASPADHDHHNDHVIAQVLLTGEAFFTGTTWRGRRAMRISVCNWKTAQADVDAVITAVDEAIAHCAANYSGPANTRTNLETHHTRDTLSLR